MELLKLGQLHQAANLPEEQKLELAKKLNVTYSIPNETFRNLQKISGYNCLHIAAKKLDIDLVNKLLKLGADPLKQGTQDGKTPVHVAVDGKTTSKGKKFWEISGMLQESPIVNTLLLTQIKNKNPYNPKCKHGFSHLHIACVFNCTQAVKYFLKNGEAINHATNSDAPCPSYTSLHFAIRYSSVEAAEILLTYGAELFAKDAHGTAPLHILINRLVDVADYMNMGQHSDCKPYEEELQRLETIAKAVIKLKSDKGLNILDETGLTIFHLACTIRDSSIAARFLNDNFDLNVALKIDSKFWPGWTPLHFAACSSAETVKLFVQKGADITMKNGKGETPLDMCLKRYTPQIVHSILSTKDQFKTICLSNSYTSLLELISTMNDTNSFRNYVRILKQFSITVNTTSPIFPGYSILHLALVMNAKTKSFDDFVEETDTLQQVASYQKRFQGLFPLNLNVPVPKMYNCTEEESRIYLDRINACLTKGCSLTLKNCDGLTPIHLAFKHLIKPDILKELLNQCKEDVLDPDGLSHLHIACAVGNQEAIKNLLSAGSNINATSKKSFQWYEKPKLPSNKEKLRLISVNSYSTPLHIAVTFEYPDIIEILLSNGANLYAVNSEGFTPIHLSITLSSNEIAKKIIGIPEDLNEVVTKEGLSHVHVAAFAGNAKAVKKLVCHVANVNRPIDVKVPDCLSSFAGKTPLEVATMVPYGKVGLAIEALIESGAGIYANDTLQCLMTDNHVDFSNFLVGRLKLSRNVRSPIHSSGLTLLHVACSRFDVSWATQLIGKGVNINARIRNDEDYNGPWKGFTPLHVLIQLRHVSVGSESKKKADQLGELLLNSGADVTIDSEDSTTLHMIYSGRKKKSVDRIMGETLYQRAVRLVNQPAQLRPWAQNILNRAPEPQIGLQLAGQNVLNVEQPQQLVRLQPVRQNVMILEQPNQLVRLQPVGQNVLNAEQPQQLGLQPVGQNVLNLQQRLQIRLQRGNQHLLNRAQEQQPVQQSFVIPVWAHPEGRPEPRIRARLVGFGNNQMERHLRRPNENILGASGNVWQDALASSMLSKHMCYKVNPVSADGFSHFHFFCMANKIEAVKKFLDNGIDINHSTNPFPGKLAGCTALHFTIIYSAFNVADVLIERGANVNVENADGSTPLHLIISQNLIDTQRNLICALKRHGANFDAKNLHGETPADILMTKRLFKHEQLQFLLDNGSSINVKKSKNLPGPASLIMLNACLEERSEVIRRFMRSDGVRTVVENGYDPIQEIVKNVSNLHSADDYLRIIIEFMKVDCEIDVDKADDKGFTAFDHAIEQSNIEAVYALIQVGVDANVCNVNTEVLQKRGRFQMEEHIAFQVYKMHEAGLYVKPDLDLIYRGYRGKNLMKQEVNVKIKRELDKAKAIKFTETLCAASFLSESRGVVYYSKLPPVHRQNIDVFFKNYDNLLKQFPIFCGLMLVQYKKAVVRPKLIETAKVVLATECEFELPDLCFECILSYLNNYELKYLTDDSEKIKNPAKRRRFDPDLMF